MFEITRLLHSITIVENNFALKTIVDCAVFVIEFWKLYTVTKMKVGPLRKVQIVEMPALALYAKILTLRYHPIEHSSGVQ